MALALYYHPLASFCHKVLIALHENGTPLEKRIVDLMDEATASRFRAMWPAGKMPVPEDSGTGRIVPETTIIIEYLEQHYPGTVRLLPSQPDALLEVRLWDRFYDLYVHSPMQKIVTDRLRPDSFNDPHGVKEARSTLQNSYEMIERQVAGKIWATGNRFTLADCAAAPALFYAGIVEPFPDGLRDLNAYFERLMERPSIKRVVADAQPYFHFFPFSADIPERFQSPSKEVPYVEAPLDPQTLDRMFHALADASRRNMVDRLARGPATVTELALPLAMGMPAVLKHLGVLEAGGIVASEKAGRVRTYRMTPAALVLAEKWVAQRKAWLTQSLDHLRAQPDAQDASAPAEKA